MGYMGVSKNSGTPKSSILIGFSWVFHYFHHPFWGFSNPLFLGFFQPYCGDKKKTHWSDHHWSDHLLGGASFFPKDGDGHSRFGRSFWSGISPLHSDPRSVYQNTPVPTVTMDSWDERYIYRLIYHKNQPNVGKYTVTMDPMLRERI